MQLTFIPRPGVPVRDPRLTPVQGGPFCYLMQAVTVDSTGLCAQQLLRHVRRGELTPGDQQTAALAGVPWAPPQPKAKAADQAENRTLTK